MKSQQERQKAGKKGSAAHRGLGIEGGANAAKSPTGTLGTSGSVSTFASATPSKESQRASQIEPLPADVCDASWRTTQPESWHDQSSLIQRQLLPGPIRPSSQQLPAEHEPSFQTYAGCARAASRPLALYTATITTRGELLSVFSRPSRPSSSHSLAHSNAAPRSGLHGKAGSTGSTSSAYRPGQAGSVYSTGSGRRHPRPSHDGSAMVRRHRTYASSTGSPSRHNSYRHDSRPSSIKSRASSPGRGGVNGMSEVGRRC